MRDRTDDDANSHNPHKAAHQGRPATIALIVLATLCVLYTCYFAAAIIVPLVLAVLLNLLLQPAKRLLTETVRLPGAVSALLLVVMLFGLIGGIGAAISVPASDWVTRMPERMPALQQKLSSVSEPFQYVQQGLQRLEQLLRHQAPKNAETAPPTMPPDATDFGSFGPALLSGARTFVGALFMLVVVLVFLLASGDSLLRNLVEIVPHFKDKQRVVQISGEIERNISGYLATITMMNVFVGIANGVSTWLCGLGDPLLWGTIAFLFNYVPILGPSCGMILFFFVGLFTYPDLWRAFLPSGLYLLIHLAEGEIITPMLLASRFTLNPVLVITSIFFWDWMWGPLGALLAVPLLAASKITCDHIPSLTALGHLIGGDRKRPPAKGTPGSANREA